MNTNNEIFISYSHLNNKWLDKTVVALKPLIREEKIIAWDDRQIRPGQNWKAEIDKALKQTSIAILLVTPEFLASDFIMKDEVSYFLEKQKLGELTILWISVSPSFTKFYPVFEEIQCINNPKMPLDSLSKSAQNEVFLKLTGTVLELVEANKDV